MRKQVSLGQLAMVSVFTLVVGCLMGFLVAQALVTIKPRSDDKVGAARQALTSSPTVLEHVTATHTPSAVTSEPQEAIPSSSPALGSLPSPTVLLKTPNLTPDSIASPTVPPLTSTVMPETHAGSTTTPPPLPKAVTATPVPLTSVTITVTEELAMQIAEDEAARARPGELTIQNPVIDITEDYIELTGQVINLGFVRSSDLRLTGVPFVEGTQLRFNVIDATVGNIPISENQFPQVEETVGKVFEQILFGYDAQSVTMRDGLIAIQAIPWR